MRALVVAAVLLVPAIARAEFVSDKLLVSENESCRFPDAAFLRDRFLVVWADYPKKRVCGRIVRRDFSMPAPSFCITDAGVNSALFPAVSASNDSFLVSWDDEGRGDAIHGQRVSLDGALVGANFPIATVAGTIRSASAFSGDRWLVVWASPASGSDVEARFVDRNGAVMGAPFAIDNSSVFAGYPSVAASPSGFLVTWDHEDGNIRARTVSLTGALGTVFTITNTRASDRSQAAWSGTRFLVQHNDQSKMGFSYDQWGRFVLPTGEPTGDPLPFASTMGFEGDTQFGGDLAAMPWGGKFFASYGTDTGMAGQELDVAGKPVGPSVVIGTGNYTSLSNAADPILDHALTVWEGVESGGAAHRVLARAFRVADVVAPDPVSGARADRDGSNVSISFTAPSTPDVKDVEFAFGETKVVPVTPGEKLTVPVATAGTSFALVARDEVGNRSTVVTAIVGAAPPTDAGVPPPGTTPPIAEEDSGGGCGCGARGGSSAILLFLAPLLRRRRR